eukprot:13169010-Ditylum_brightwellii.AAC.1
MLTFVLVPRPTSTPAYEPSSVSTIGLILLHICCPMNSIVVAHAYCLSIIDDLVSYERSYQI